MLKMKVNQPRMLKLNYSGGSSVVVDEFPTESSKNAVSSGGVYTSLEYLDKKIDSRIPFVTFEIENGYLLMNEADNKEITFELDDNGNLFVVI